MIRKFAMVTLVLALIVFGATGALVSSSRAASVSQPSSGGGSLQQAYNLGQAIDQLAADPAWLVMQSAGHNHANAVIEMNIVGSDQGGSVPGVRVNDPSCGQSYLFGGELQLVAYYGDNAMLNLQPAIAGSPAQIRVNNLASDLALQPGSAAPLTSNSTTTSGAFAPITSESVFLGRPSNGFARLYMDYTNTATVGNVTINKPAGRVKMGAGLGLLTVTDDTVTTSSHIFLNADSAPGNVVAVMFYAVAGAGSFTVNAVPAVTNQTSIDFFVVNAN